MLKVIAKLASFLPKHCKSGVSSGGPAGVPLVVFLGFEIIPVALNNVINNVFLFTSYSVKPFVITPKFCAITNLWIGAVLGFNSFPRGAGISL